MDQKTCENCFWQSKDGYCTEGGRPPRQTKEICDKYTPVKNSSAK